MTDAPAEDRELVRRTDQDRVATLTLDSPRNRNALSRRLVADLARHLQHVAADESLLAVLLRAEGRAFCAGADLAEAAHVDMVESARGIVAAQRLLAAVPVPVVVRVDGPVRAGGLGLLACADVVVCRDDVTFALTEVRLGLAAATISIPLLHRVPSRVLSDWMLTGRAFDATEAAAGGLITRAVPGEGMDGALEAVLDDLRAGKRQGLVEAKRLLVSDLLADFDDRGEDMAVLSGRLFHSEVAQQAMAAAVRR